MWNRADCRGGRHDYAEGFAVVMADPGGLAIENTRTAYQRIPRLAGLASVQSYTSPASH